LKRKGEARWRDVLTASRRLSVAVRRLRMVVVRDSQLVTCVRASLALLPSGTMLMVGQRLRRQSSASL
jgi:hypothetical protein